MRQALFGLACGLALMTMPLRLTAAETIDLDGLKSKAPADWKFVEPKNPPGFKARVYQATWPKVEGDPEDAELIIFYFGKGSGGSVDDNMKRQLDKFDPPEGKKLADVMKKEELTVGKVKVAYLDVAGTFKSKFPPFDPNAKVTRKDNFRELYAVFQSPNGPYFIQVIGPAKTVAKYKDGFEAWLKKFE